MADLELMVELAYRTCPVCAIAYAVPADWLERKRQNGGNWFCPAGHSLVFTQTEADRLRKQLEASIRREQSANERAESYRYKRDHQARRAAAAKGQVTKIKRRVSKGICPCCNKTFPNLAAHMEGEHPEYAAENDNG